MFLAKVSHKAILAESSEGSWEMAAILVLTHSVTGSRWHEVHTCCTPSGPPLGFFDHQLRHLCSMVVQGPGFYRTPHTIRGNKNRPRLHRVLIEFQLIPAVPYSPSIPPSCLTAGFQSPISGTVITVLQRPSQCGKPGPYNSLKCGVCIVPEEKSETKCVRIQAHPH